MHGCRAACKIIEKSNLFSQHRFGAARQVLRKSHTSTAQLQSKLSSSKRIKIIHIARQRSSLPVVNESRNTAAEQSAEF